MTLVLEDGREYGVAGTLQFADVTVDPSTGSIALRALFPNPRGELLPGMFVRARLEEGVNPQALLVPQRAVTRDQKGQPIALVVDTASKVERRQLVTDRAIGDAWLVTQRRRGRRAGHRRGAAEGPARRRGEAGAGAKPAKPRRGRDERRRSRARSRSEPDAVARFFIDRPIFAWVIAIIIMLAGALSIFALPVSQYPAIAPPAISVSATLSRARRRRRSRTPSRRSSSSG